MFKFSELETEEARLNAVNTFRNAIEFEDIEDLPSLKQVHKSFKKDDGDSVFDEEGNYLGEQEELDEENGVEKFSHHYDLDTSIVGEESDQEGLLETFGKDIAKVLEINEKSPKKVWTLVDGDDGRLWAVAGFHYVNRVAYLITKKEWTNETEQYLDE